MQAKDVMTTPVLTVKPDTSIQEVAAFLLERRISGVPVVGADGRMVGILSEGDLLRRVETKTTRHRSRWLELIVDDASRAAEFTKTHGGHAGDVMTREVVQVAPETDLREIAEIMERQRIKRVPVAVDGKPVGIVSRANLLHALVAYGKVPEGAVAASDPDIRRAVIDQLRHETWVDLEHLNVVVSHGIVHLWGIVKNDDQRRALKVAVESVPQVKGVEEHLSPNWFVNQAG